jgi:mono/diheme cytochrome c family protein
MTYVRRTAWLMAAGLAGILLGCQRGNAPKAEATAAAPLAVAAPADPGTDSGPFAAGKRVYAAYNCSRCHSVGGPGGPFPGGPRRMGRKGPDLAKVGADPGHTVEWLEEHVRNPKSHKPDSRMPGFEAKIKPEDLRSLAEYLASLK